MPVIRGQDHHKTTLIDAQVIEMRELYVTGKYSYAQLAVRYGIDKSSIGRIIIGNTWRHLPVLPAPEFHWKA